MTNFDRFLPVWTMFGPDCPVFIGFDLFKNCFESFLSVFCRLHRLWTGFDQICTYNSIEFESIAPILDLVGTDVDSFARVLDCFGQVVSRFHLF